MRSPAILAVSTCFWLGAVGAGMAQPVDNGLEVRVNPYAGRSSSVLLYPGGEFGRVVPQLLYPGQKYGPINLHMPSRRRHVAIADVPAKPRAPKIPKAPKVAAAQPAPAPEAQQPYNSGYASFAGGTPVNPFGAPAPKPAAKPAPAPKPAPPAPKPAPTQVAKAEPPPAQSTPAPAAEAGLTKRSVILFAKGATDPAAGALGSIKFLAGDLNSAMTRSASRIELQAFGGNKGDKGSDARRLSLKRALAIRQVLIDDGVSPDRIDVRAMGGADDSGPSDRVDVYVRA
jgi:outer membrane protein OmpA-like peptidoglycan-associated protein